MFTAKTTQKSGNDGRWGKRQKSNNQRKGRVVEGRMFVSTFPPPTGTREWQTFSTLTYGGRNVPSNILHWSSVVCIVCGITGGRRILGVWRWFLKRIRTIQSIKNGLNIQVGQSLRHKLWSGLVGCLFSPEKRFIDFFRDHSSGEKSVTYFSCICWTKSLRISVHCWWYSCMHSANVHSCEICSTWKFWWQYQLSCTES